MEGTGGSAVFKNFSTSKGSDVTKAENKQNLVKWSSPYDSETFLDLESGNKNKKPLKKVKRHRRWKIGKVINIKLIEKISYIILAYLIMFHGRAVDR